MAFTKKSAREIWRREGGRKKAICFSCGRAYKDGWNLDCSHLDHTRNAYYDDPDRGVLECLHCHLLRHLDYFFECALANDLKAIRVSRYCCEELITRLFNGDAKHPYPSEPRDLDTLFKLCVQLEDFVSAKLADAALCARERGESPLNIDTAMLWSSELRSFLVLTPAF